MTTSYTLTGNLAGAFGGDLPSPSGVYATIGTNLGDVPLVDLDADEVSLPGSRRLTVNDDLTFSVDLIATDSTGTNVADGTLRYVLNVQYGNGRNSKRTWSSGYFELTADIDLADVVITDYIAPSVTSALIAQMETIRDQTEAIAGLTGEDEALAAVVGNEGSATYAALTDPDGAVSFAVEEAVESHTPGISLGAPVRISNFTTTNIANTSTAGNIAELQKTIVGQGRPVALTFYAPGVWHSVANTKVSVAIILDGNILGANTQVGTARSALTNDGPPLLIIRETGPLNLGVSYPFTVRVWGAVAGTSTLVAASYLPIQFSITSR